MPSRTIQSIIQLPELSNLPPVLDLTNLNVAASFGSNADVDNALALNPDIDVVDANGDSALNYACYITDHANMDTSGVNTNIHHLISLGANPNTLNDQGNITGFIAMLTWIPVDVLSELIDATNVNTQNGDHDTMMHYAVFGYYVDGVEFLLSMPGCTSQVNDEGETPLDTANRLYAESGSSDDALLKIIGDLEVAFS